MNNIFSEKLSEISIPAFSTGIGFGMLFATLVKMPTLRMLTLLKVFRNKKLSLNSKMVLIVRDDTIVDKGKIACHCVNATISCVSAVRQYSPDLARSWILSGMPKIVLKLDSTTEQGLYDLSKKAKNLGVVSTIIKNTTGPNQYATVLGLGPAESHVVDSISGHLKLM